MAIKDQCINCKSFNGNVCLLTFENEYDPDPKGRNINR